jgi:hypothetical protein
MFTLIIQIIAIALGIAMTISGVFYGGEALSRGTAKATAATFVNQGAQLNAANTMFKNDNSGSSVVALADMVTGKYLINLPKVPKGDDWSLAAGKTYNIFSYDGTTSVDSSTTSVTTNSVEVKGGATVVANEVCNEINRAANLSNIYGCVLGATEADNLVWYRI